MSEAQKANQRKRLKSVDSVIEAIRLSGVSTKSLVCAYCWRRAAPAVVPDDVQSRARRADTCSTPPCSPPDRQDKCLALPKESDMPAAGASRAQLTLASLPAR